MLILTDAQKVTLTISPVSAAGNPAPVQNPSWSVSDAEVLSVVVAEDGLSAVVSTVGKLGDAQVSVTADADMGEGVKELTGVLDISVKASDAVSLNITAGNPEDK